MKGLLDYFCIRCTLGLLYTLRQVTYDFTRLNLLNQFKDKRVGCVEDYELHGSGTVYTRICEIQFGSFFKLFQTTQSVGLAYLQFLLQILRRIDNRDTKDFAFSGLDEWYFDHLQFVCRNVPQQPLRTLSVTRITVN